jgi:hypothetical protein
MNCGYYKDRNVVDVQAALIKKEKKMKERNKVGGSASSSK